MITKKNFYIASRGVFVLYPHPPQFADFTSKSCSEYWFTANGVIRRSNHWGSVLGCQWQLMATGIKQISTDGKHPWALQSMYKGEPFAVSAFCRFSDMQWLKPSEMLMKPQELLELFESDPVSVAEIKKQYGV